MREHSSHQFQYPCVVAIPPRNEQAGDDDFHKAAEGMIESLGERLIKHNESQMNYYERQRDEAAKHLARVTMIYSDQLQFDFEVGDGE